MKYREKKEKKLDCFFIYLDHYRPLIHTSDWWLQTTSQIHRSVNFSDLHSSCLLLQYLALARLGCLVLWVFPFFLFSFVFLSLLFHHPQKIFPLCTSSNFPNSLRLNYLVFDLINFIKSRWQLGKKIFLLFSIYTPTLANKMIKIKGISTMYL